MHRESAICLTLGLALLAGCRAGPSATTAAALPLQRGYYVASDVACADASNATLALLHRHGLNASREACTFAGIEPLGPDRYRIIEQCSQIGIGEESRWTVHWQLLSHESFLRTLDTGWTSQMRYCPQQALPEPWRDTDITDATG